MSRVILSALLSFWRRNPLQLFTLIAGLALATALWSGVQAINAEARASYDAAAATLGEGRYAQITDRDGGAIAQADYIALRRAGWRVSPVIEGRIEGVRLVGLEPLTAPRGLGPVRPGEGGDLGAFLSGTGQVFARADTLARLPDLEAELVTAPDIAPNTALADIGVVQRLLDRPGQIDRLIVRPDQPRTRRPLDEVAPGLRRVAPREGGDVARLTDSFHLNLTAFGLLSFAVGLFIVHGAIGLAFEQRRPLVRTLRALGVPLRRLIVLMAAELAALALIAGVIGVALGYVIAAALLPDVAATLRGLYGADIAGQLNLRPAWWLSGLAIALGGTAVAASGALWSLARMPLLSGAQPRAWAMARRGVGQTVLAGVLLVIAGVLAVTGGGLIAGFAMLGALLIGGALALPPVLALVLRLSAARARSVVAQWFWADTRQQVPGLSLALMALLLAMAANVGVSTMVSSFRLTFVGFLDQRLASELYVSAEDRAQADRVRQVAADRADAILPILSVDRDVAGLPAQIFGARDHATYRDNWQFLRSVPDAWDRLARGDGVVINEQLFRRAGLDLGTEIAIAPGLRLPVLGIYGDYGNPIGQVIAAEDLFRSLYPGCHRAALWPAHRHAGGAAHGAARARRGARERDDRSGGDQGPVAVGIRADLCRDRRAQRADARGGGVRHPDEPSDAGGDAPAAARPGLGARAHAAPAGTARSAAGGGARGADGRVRAAARAGAGLGAAGGGQCRGVRLAPADVSLSAGLPAAGRARAGGGGARGALAGVAAVAHPAGATPGSFPQ